jgi:hypothetical protein
MHAHKSHALLLTKINADGHGSEMPSLIVDNSLTPSSIDLQAGCTLRALISANFPSSPCLPLDHSSLQPSFLMGFLWKANHHNGLFPLPIFQKRQNKNKNKHYMLITNLQKGLTKIHP